MRLALALAFLSWGADRCGLLGPPGTPGVAWRNFANFLSYWAAVNSFAPSMLQSALTITATILEGSLPVLLLVGLFTRFRRGRHVVTSLVICSRNDDFTWNKTSARLLGSIGFMWRFVPRG
jgi:uncharacterized membrane protein YphA (DoxX/SURF4 family)